MNRTKKICRNCQRHWTEPRSRRNHLNHSGVSATALLTALGVMPVVMGQIQFDWPVIPDGIDKVSEPSNPAVADFDRDGLADVAISGPFIGIQVFRNEGNGEFALYSAVNPDTKREGGSVQAEDVDLDGDFDLVWTSRDSLGNHLIEIAINDGDGLVWQLQVLEVAEATERLVLGDLDGDGDLDIVRATREIISILENDGGTFQGEEVIHDRSPGDYRFRDLLVGDFDRDGDVDIAALIIDGDSYGNRYYVYYKVYDSEIVLLSNDGSGRFENERVIELPYRNAIEMAPRRIKAADMDGDRDLDFAVLIGNTDPVDEGKPAEFLIVRNDLESHSYFVGKAVQFGHSDAFALDVADIDSDGRLDVIAGTYQTTAVYVIPNIGHLQFGEERIFPTDVQFPRMIIARDLTGDGQLDLMMSGWRDYLTLLTNLTPLPNHPRLSTTPLIRGEVSQTILTGLEPGERAWIALTDKGWANTLGIPFFGSLTFDLGSPLLGSQEVIADDSGIAVLEWKVPMTAPLGPIVLQGVVRRGADGAKSIKTPFVTSVISEQ